MIVLAVKQAGLRSQVVETPHSAVVQQPATLRDIRKRLKELRSTQTESAAVDDAADTDDD